MQLLTRTPTRKYFVSIFLIVSALFIAFSVVIYNNYTEARRLNSWTLYNYELIRQSRKILMDIVDMETGVRGYFLTGKKQFLDPYRDSQMTLAGEIEKLWAYTKNDPDTREDIEAWLKEIEVLSKTLNGQVVAFHQKGKVKPSLTDMEKQRAQMDRLRTMMEGFISQRRDRLQKQIHTTMAAQDDFKYILGFGTVLAIGGMFLATLLFLLLVARNQRAENAARALEDRFQTVMNGVNDGLYDYDVESGTIYYSPTYKTMLGYNADEFPNTPEMSHACIHPDDYEAVMENFRRYKIGEIAVYRNVFRMMHKDGSWLWILSRGVGLRDERGVVVRLIGTHTNITEQKMREEELRQLNNEMETFTYITSHDLRAPLVNLRGFASEMEQGIASVLPVLERAKNGFTDEEKTLLHQVLHRDIPESLSFIKQSVTKMDALTTAVLDLSRIGRREYKHEPVDMNAILQRCLDTQAYEISKKNITVHCEHLPMCMSDALALEQIFSNLLDNAIKYLDPAREGVIRIGTQQDGKDVVFYVQDNGRGIAEADYDKVFQIFRRARNAQNVRGLGMGMTYVQATLRRLGGSIWFQSSQDVGTTFYFNLPSHRRMKDAAI